MKVTVLRGGKLSWFSFGFVFVLGKATAWLRRWLWVKYRMRT